MLNNLSDREKLYDDIRRECEVSFDGGVCLELLIDEVDNKKLKNLLEEYIIKTCNEFYKKTFKKSDNFLKEYKQQKEYMPTVREMQNYMKAKSTSSISQMLGYIEWKGYIKKHPSMARAIEIIKEVA